MRDFVVATESEHDTMRFIPELAQRLAKFGLQISVEKTRVLKFGRRVWYRAQKQGKKVETFDFLGFTHYCAKSRKGYFVMMHKTSRRAMTRKLNGINEWLRNVRSMVPLKEGAMAYNKSKIDWTLQLLWYKRQYTLATEILLENTRYDIQMDKSQRTKEEGDIQEIRKLSTMESSAKTKNISCDTLLKNV